MTTRPTRYLSQQEHAVSRLIAGESCAAIFPTGAGKSICYQVPGALMAKRGLGLTLVVSPLIALMKDQVRLLIIAVLLPLSVCLKYTGVLFQEFYPQRTTPHHDEWVAPWAARATRIEAKLVLLAGSSSSPRWRFADYLRTFASLSLAAGAADVPKASNDVRYNI